MLAFARDVALAAVRVLYLFAPLLVSAALFGIARRFRFLRALDRPIDAGRSFHGERLLGDGKTWRGVLVAVVGSVATVAFQKAVRTHAAGWELVDYRKLSPVSFGAAMGVGAMLGELPNSFVKRRLGIPQGGTSRGWTSVLFYVWDQVDLLTGAWPLVVFWVWPRVLVVVVSFALALAIHPLVALVGYAVGARDSPR